MESPSSRQKGPQICFVRGSATVWTRYGHSKCEIGVLGLSVKLFRTIGDFPNDPMQSPIEILGGAKMYVCTHKFLDVVQLHPPAPPLPPPLWWTSWSLLILAQGC